MTIEMHVATVTNRSTWGRAVELYLCTEYLRGLHKLLLLISPTDKSYITHTCVAC